MNRMEKKKVIMLLMVVLIVSASGLAMIYVSSEMESSTPINMEIEESVDVSFNQWDTVTKLYYTAIVVVDDYITVVDTSTWNRAEMSLSFNSIDIGYVKLKLRMPNEIYQEDFTIEFLSNGYALFKLERICDSLALIIGTLQMKVLDWDTNWHTIEIFFDLSISGEGKISIKADGNEVVDDLMFIPANEEIDTIHMYTDIANKNVIDVIFEKLNNLKKI